MPPLVLAIVSYITLAIKAAPAIKAVYDDGKALIQSLFSANLISEQQQAALMAWADTPMVMTLAGTMPPEFSIEEFAAIPAAVAAAKSLDCTPPETAPAAPAVVCEKCGTACIADSPDNCRC